MEKGFKRVRPLAGGLDAWLEAGFEVEGTLTDAPSRTSTLPSLPAV
jgi:hypothetical protein